MTVDRFPAEVRPIVAQAEALERRVYELERRLGRGNPRGQCACPSTFCTGIDATLVTNASDTTTLSVSAHAYPATLQVWWQATIHVTGAAGSDLGWKVWVTTPSAVTAWTREYIYPHFGWSVGAALKRSIAGDAPMDVINGPGTVGWTIQNLTVQTITIPAAAEESYGRLMALTIPIVDGGAAPERCAETVEGGGS